MNNKTVKHLKLIRSQTECNLMIWHTVQSLENLDFYVVFLLKSLEDSNGVDKIQHCQI